MGTGGSGGGAGSSGGGAGGASSGGTGGSSGQCSKPGSLHTNTIYCPFSATGGGKNLYCTPGTQHCCEGLTSGDVSTCEAAATACPANWTDWVCQKDADCGGGVRAARRRLWSKNTDQSCANYASKFHATQCEATCATGEVHMCTADADCGSGKTCLPFSTKGAQVGGCYRNQRQGGQVGSRLAATVEALAHGRGVAVLRQRFAQRRRARCSRTVAIFTVMPSSRATSSSERSRRSTCSSMLWYSGLSPAIKPRLHAQDALSSGVCAVELLGQLAEALLVAGAARVVMSATARLSNR